MPVAKKNEKTTKKKAKKTATKKVVKKAVASTKKKVVKKKVVSSSAGTAEKVALAEANKKTKKRVVATTKSKVMRGKATHKNKTSDADAELSLTDKILQEKSLLEEASNALAPSKIKSSKTAGPKEVTSKSFVKVAKKENNKKAFIEDNLDQKNSQKINEDIDDDEVEAATPIVQKSQVQELEDKIRDEIVSLSEDFKFDEIREFVSDINFSFHRETDDCLEGGCENLQTTEGYCRFHYIKNWYIIKKKQQILADGKLQGLVVELISKYSRKHIESILQDLSSEKEFYNALRDMDMNVDFEANSEDEIDDSDDDINVETGGIGHPGAKGFEDEEAL